MQRRSWLVAPFSVGVGYLAMSLVVGLLLVSPVPDSVVAGTDGLPGMWWPFAHPLYFGLGLLVMAMVAAVVFLSGLVRSRSAVSEGFSATGWRVGVGVAVFTAVVMLDDGLLFDVREAFPLDTFEGGAWAGFGAAVVAGVAQSRLIRTGIGC